MGAKNAKEEEEIERELRNVVTGVRYKFSGGVRLPIHGGEGRGQGGGEGKRGQTRE